MSINSSIEWTENTWNPVSGCTRVSAGCDNCYAATMTARLEAMGKPKYVGLTAKNAKGDLHFNGKIRLDDNSLALPLTWKKPRRVFVNSMSDLFHRDVPFDFIDKMFAVMALCPQHTFQVLTKRPERMAHYLTRCNGAAYQISVLKAAHLFQGGISAGWICPLPNLWLGTSVEDQAAADERIPHLLKCPAAVRFLSAEPLLGPIEFSDVSKRSDAIAQLRRRALDGIDWVIVGGESGHGARKCDMAWIASIVNQCKIAGVATFVKQLGAWPVRGAASIGMVKDPKGGDIDQFPIELRVREFPEPVAATDPRVAYREPWQR